MEPITIHHNVLADPHAYRAAALRQDFHDVPLAGQTFRGIAEAPHLDVLVALLELVPSFTPTLSFLRKSPKGQVEPNYIHSDADMGDLTAIYYMTKQRHPLDSTLFWRHVASDRIDGPWDSEPQAAATDLAQWRPWRIVPAEFNSLLLFKSDLFHSRGIVENYGFRENARLIHVVFGTLNPKPW